MFGDPVMAVGASGGTIQTGEDKVITQRELEEEADVLCGEIKMWEALTR